MTSSENTFMPKRVRIGDMVRGARRPVVGHEVIAWMAKSRADFTNTFRDLSSEELPASDPDFQAWHSRWLERLNHERKPKAEVFAQMRIANPAVIPRDHRVEARAVHSMEPLAVPRLSQPRLPVPLLQASALGHRNDRPEHRRHCDEHHQRTAGLAAHGEAHVWVRLMGWRTDAGRQAAAAARPTRSGGRVSGQLRGAGFAPRVSVNV